jgi:hypothetical protein
VLAEANHPGKGGVVPLEVLERAALWVDFTLACWRALPETDMLALSRKDGLLDRAITRLVDWLESHGGRATRRQLLRGHVGGVQTRTDLDELLERYRAVYPGTIRQERPTAQGAPAEAIYAPLRHPVATQTTRGNLSPATNSEIGGDALSDPLLSSEASPGDSANGICRRRQINLSPATNSTVATNSPPSEGVGSALQQLFDEVLERAGPDVNERAAQAIVQAFNVALTTGATDALLLSLEQYLPTDLVARAREVLA